MLAISKNIDFICLQLRNDDSQLNFSLKKDLNKLLNDIKDIITSKKKIKPMLDSQLGQIFNFRIKAIKWLFKEEGSDLLKMLDEIYSQLEELKEDPKLEILIENILFALRCNRRVVEALVETDEFSKEDFGINLTQLPAITYQQFIVSIALGVPDDETAQKIVDWTNASLYIEFITVASAIINDKNLKISRKTIDELAFLVANAAQEYSALSYELGILKPKLSRRQGAIPPKFDRKFIKEQKLLADLGMDDFAANLLD